MSQGIKHTFDDMPEITSSLCPQCGRTIRGLVEGELCPMCLELNLFADVREYIRSNDVNEFQVAEHFDLPREKIKQWIKEGKIEYKESPDGVMKLSDGYCQRCGRPIKFGNLCPQCKREETKAMKGVGIVKISDEDSKMRFLEGDNKK